MGGFPERGRRRLLILGGPKKTLREAQAIAEADSERGL